MEANNVKKSESKEDFPKKLSEEAKKIINEQLHQCICKIHGKNGIFGTGYFCKVPVSINNEIKYFPLLFTSNHVLNEEEIIKEKKVQFSFEDGIIKEIIINNNRKVHENKSVGNTMVEIFPEEDKINHFLEMEPLGNIEKVQKNKNADIYVLQTDKCGKNIVTFGIMGDLNNFKSKSLFKGKKYSLGSPILLLESFKVIASVADLKKIEETNSNHESNKNFDIKSEISLKVLVDETNINKDVYIINGPYYIIDEDTILKGYDLKEINENNVLMYINGVETKKNSIKKGFTPLI